MSSARLLGRAWPLQATQRRRPSALRWTPSAATTQQRLPVRGGRRAYATAEPAPMTREQKMAAREAERREALTPEQRQQWQQCVEVMQALGFSQEDADKFIARAFGWNTQAYWRFEKEYEVPDAGVVNGVIAYLNGVGIAGKDLQKVVKAFPEVLSCSVQERLAANVAQLQQQWKLQGAVLKNAIIRQPAILGFVVDCEGSCIGECNRCWVRF